MSDETSTVRVIGADPERVVSAIEGDLSSVGEALGVAFSMFVECMPDAASTVAEELSSVLDAMRESGLLDDE